jgi:hypothetical protein
MVLGVAVVLVKGYLVD